MDSGWKIAIATIAAAIIMAAAAVYSANIGLLKPTEAQLEKSTQFKDVVDASRSQISEIEALRRQISEQNSLRVRLAEEAEGQRVRIAALEERLASIRMERPVDPMPSFPQKAQEQTPAQPSSPPRPEPPSATREKMVLFQGKPTTLWGTTTVTLDYAKDTAKLIINGTNYRRLRVGSRVELSPPKGQVCAFEVMDLNNSAYGGENMTVDLVCQRA